MVSWFHAAQNKQIRHRRQRAQKGLCSLLIFHSPLSVRQNANLKSGSSVRPAAMLAAFEDLGVDTILVDGPSQVRSGKWKSVLQSGQKILGVYSELSTMPIGLSDPDHFPRAPFLDFAHFARLRRVGVPVAAFYRDVYWRFPHYSTVVPLHKRLPAQAFYRLEAWQVARHTDHVFLPSLRMKTFVPHVKDMEEVSALPPGGLMREASRIGRTGPLHLFYVGGVGSAQYDVSPMLRAVEAIEGVRLTLCCREPEWQAIRSRFRPLRNVNVVHHSGDQLEQYFRSADIFLMWWKMVDYLRFAMPVKLGEAVGWGLPIITNSQSEMGGVVQRDKLGWTPDTEEKLGMLLKHLRDNREKVIAAQESVMKMRDRHTWRARAQTVLSVLQKH